MASWGGEHSRWCEHLERRPFGESKHLQIVECGQTERELWSRSGQQRNGSEGQIMKGLWEPSYGHRQNGKSWLNLKQRAA